MAERGEVLDSLPSGSSGLYASAEDESLPSHSRASSFSGMHLPPAAAGGCSHLYVARVVGLPGCHADCT